VGPTGALAATLFFYELKILVIRIFDFRYKVRVLTLVAEEEVVSELVVEEVVSEPVVLEEARVC